MRLIGRVDPVIKQTASHVTLGAYARSAAQTNVVSWTRGNFRKWRSWDAIGSFGGIWT